MRTLSIIALIAATASPALAFSPADIAVQNQTVTSGAISVVELFDDERNGNPATRAGERPDEAKDFIVGELFEDERSGNPTTRAGERPDEAKNFIVGELSEGERNGQEFRRHTEPRVA